MGFHKAFPSPVTVQTAQTQEIHRLEIGSRVLSWRSKKRHIGENSGENKLSEKASGTSPAVDRINREVNPMLTKKERERIHDVTAQNWRLYSIRQRVEETLIELIHTSS